MMLIEIFVISTIYGVYKIKKNLDNLKNENMEMEEVKLQLQQKNDECIMLKQELKNVENTFREEKLVMINNNENTRETLETMILHEYNNEFINELGSLEEIEESSSLYYNNTDNKLEYFNESDMHEEFKSVNSYEKFIEIERHYEQFEVQMDTCLVYDGNIAKMKLIYENEELENKSNYSIEYYYEAVEEEEEACETWKEKEYKNQLIEIEDQEDTRVDPNKNIECEIVDDINTYEYMRNYVHEKNDLDIGQMYKIYFDDNGIDDNETSYRDILKKYT